MCTLHLDNVADAQAAVQRCRRMFDLDADPDTVEAHFADDPILAQLGSQATRACGRPGIPTVSNCSPGRCSASRCPSKGRARWPRGWSPRSASHWRSPVEGVTHTFPSAAAIAGCATSDFAMPAARARALINACEQLAVGGIVIDAGSDRDEIARQLESLPGIGPWTAELRGAASTRGPRRVLADRHRRTQRAARHRCRLVPEGRRSTRRVVATMALVCAAPPLGKSVRRRAGEMLHTITMSSPVGDLRLIAGDRGLRAILWGVGGCGPPRLDRRSRPRRGPHRRARSGGGPTRGVLRRYTARVRPSSRSSRNAVPAVGMDGAAHDSVRSHDELRRSRPVSSAIPTRPARSAPRTARTR